MVELRPTRFYRHAGGFSPKSNRKCKFILARVTAQDYRDLRRWARGARMSLSEFVREMIYIIEEDIRVNGDGEFHLSTRPMDRALEQMEKMEPLL